MKPKLFVSVFLILIQVSMSEKFMSEKLTSKELINESLISDNKIINNSINQPNKKSLIIVGQYRSGSSFTGELFSSFPSSFYYFEPFHPFKNNSVPVNETGIRLINEFVNCNFDVLVRNNEWKGMRWSLTNELVKMVDPLSDSDTNYDVKVIKTKDPLMRLKSMCEKSKGIVIKAIRLRMDLVEECFNHNLYTIPRENIHIILLIRDPRGIINSRMSFGACNKRPDCLNASKLCNDMRDDYLIYKKLKKKFPNNFHLVKFEDLVKNPKRVSFDLYQKIGFEVTPKLGAFINLHTKVNNLTVDLVKGHPFNTFRESKIVAKKWRSKLRRKVIRRIEKDCSEFLDLLNYEKVFFH